MIITINFSLIFSMNVYCLENPIDTGAWQATVHGVTRVGHDLMTKPQYMLLNIGGSDGKESACSAGDLGSIPGLENPLEKEMATHSSVLAWRITWTEEPGRLQSMGSQELDIT